jgi:hypothetical protein
LPIALPPMDRARFHLVVTVHGISGPCRALWGGTGSLMLRTDLRGADAHTNPFMVGDLDPDATFVHVLDDTTMDLVLGELDTLTDFVGYLRAKERACRDRTLMIAGEENLLAIYKTTLVADGSHGFDFDSEADVTVLDESHWEAFERSEERKSQIASDHVSYVWDALIEQFGSHTLDGTSYASSEPAFGSAEKILRFMAAESRFRRRMLAEALLEAIETTPDGQRRLRVVPSQQAGEPTYVFLLFPWWDKKSEQENRLARRQYLEACVQVARMRFPGGLDVIGITTEAGGGRAERSEDAIYLDGRDWGPARDADARALQRDLQILVAPKRTARQVDEYPAGSPRPQPRRTAKNPRNKPCHCGSDQKFKRCHGA